MGDQPSAELFFGMTRWVDEDELDSLQGAFVYKADVIFEHVSCGWDEGTEEFLVAVMWKKSRIEQGAEYDTAFTMPSFDVPEASKALIDKWKEIGFEPVAPSWHLISSCG
jgi:hypothetical protein